MLVLAKVPLLLFLSSLERIPDSRLCEVWSRIEQIACAFLLLEEEGKFSTAEKNAIDSLAS
jgi:hypothetical protein